MSNPNNPNKNPKDPQRQNEIANPDQQRKNREGGKVAEERTQPGRPRE